MKNMYKLLTILLFIIIEVLVIQYINLSNKREVEHTLDENTSSLEVKYFASSNAYALLSDDIFSHAINNPEVLELFSKAYTATESQRQIIRDSLYKLLLPEYEFQKKINIKQLIFILPNNESFLRFHRPQKFGDDLTDFRYSVKMTNLTQKVYRGFEEGKTYNGFRNIYPLNYNGNHIGAIEISFSSNSIKEQIEERMGGSLDIGFMLKKEIVDKKVSKNERSNYETCVISDNYVVENQYNNLKKSIELLKQLDIKIKKSIEAKFVKNENFTVSYKIKKDYYLFSFVSINNVEGNPIAYIYSYKINNIIADHKVQYYIALIASFILFILLTILILILISKNEKLILAQEKETLILNTFNDGIYINSPDYKIIYANSSLQKTMGQNPIDEKCYKAIYSLDSVCEWCIYKQLNSSNKTIEYETKKDEKILLVNNLLLSNNDKLTIFRDVTEKRIAEEAIILSEKKSRKMNAEKDKFFSIIAHDLKNPFNTMLGFTDILMNNYDTFETSKHKEFISIIHNEAEKTFKLLENLLLWARTQQNVVEYMPDNDNLYLLVTTTIDLLNQTALNKSIIINNKIPENISVYADRNMLSTIVRNIISNAIKFTPKNGNITIQSNTIFNKNNEKFVEIIIEDNGIGISKDVQGKLFNIADNITTRGTENEAGTGLGLILCKEFVERHNGEISIESEIGVGSKFIFSIPMAIYK